MQSDSITEDKDWDFYESIEQERCNSNQGPGGPEGMKNGNYLCVQKPLVSIIQCTDCAATNDVSTVLEHKRRKNKNSFTVIRYSRKEKA